jgi:CRISPR/Cas system endoribonuclease Cas6 (RAMP superfamily)
MKIGGIVGELVVKNLSPLSYRLLRYGEISGVGKLSTFGLGKIKVEDLV